MSYDFSFLGNEWNEIKEKIKESQIILKYNSRDAIYTSMEVCKKVVTKVLEIEKIEKQESVQLSIQTLRQRNIIDESLNIKFRDIYEEYIILRREPNTKINTRVSERCIANIYDILKWYSNKYDMILSQYNLDFLSNYRDIKAELMDVRSILFYDTMNLQRKYNDAVRKCRVAIEGIVREVQIKSGISKRGDLNSNIMSIEPIMGSAAIPILQKIRRDGNGAIHINDNGRVNIVKKEHAIKVFEDTYNLAKVFSIYMEMQKLKKPYSTPSNQNEGKQVQKPSDTNKSNGRKTDQNTIKIHKGNWNDLGYYEGETQNNLRHGKGKFKYKDGRIYDGQWKNDQKEGFGKDLDKNGLLYKGEFKENKRHGKGKKEYKDGSIYDGQWKLSQKHGNGKLTYKDGTIYEGKWLEDKKNDEFTITKPGVGIYKGKYKNDEVVGNWILIKLDNTKVQLKIEDGKFIEIKPQISQSNPTDYNKKNKSDIKVSSFCGNWQNKGHYEGDIKDNKRHGQGKFKYAHGDIYEGKWINDKREGKGCLTKTNKVVEQGVWQNDKKNGEFTITDPTIGVYTGSCKNDEYIGQWILTRLDNKKVNVKVKGNKFIEINTNTSSKQDENKKNNVNKKSVVNSPKKFSGDWKNEGYYEGDIKDNLRHGKGKFTYKDGSIYNGEWSNDRINGHGTMSYKNGNIYIGEWTSPGGNEKYFSGEIKYSNGEIYEGRCAYTKASKTYVRFGKGKMIYNNGYIYEGGWENNLKHGIFEVKKWGFITLEESGTYKGRCERDKHIGDWTLVNIDNSKVPVKFNGKEFVKIELYDTKEFKNIIAQCEEKKFSKGTYKGELKRFLFKYERHGVGIMKYDNGDIYEGQWAYNYMDGVGKMTYANGDIYEGEWNANTKHGNGKMIYANGIVYEGQWKFERKL